LIEQALEVVFVSARRPTASSSPWPSMPDWSWKSAFRPAALHGVAAVVAVVVGAADPLVVAADVGGAVVAPDVEEVVGAAAVGLPMTFFDEEQLRTIVAATSSAGTASKWVRERVMATIRVEAGQADHRTLATDAIAAATGNPPYGGA
jgi:hypothetical protein